MLIRILTVREHKLVIFCDVCSNNANRRQMLVEKSRFPEIHFKIGDVLDCELKDGFNNRGLPVIILEGINHLYQPSNFSSYKSFSESSKDKDTGALQDLVSNFLNGGNAHAAHLLREAVLDFVEQYMKKKGIHREYTPITTAYRGTSIASPQRAEGVYTGHRFIKITHELGLKIACYMMLQSVYEIGYVCRDRYANQSNLNEFLTIEGVATLNSDFCLSVFFHETWKKAIEIAETLELDFNDDLKDIVIVDFVKEYGSVPKKKDVAICMDLYDKLVLQHVHMIVINAPIDSPLVYSEVDDLPLETKWIYKGKGIGHGYKDEYRVENVYKSFEEQREILASKQIECDLPMDYLEILSSSGFPTQSFVIGIERLISNIVDNNKIIG